MKIIRVPTVNIASIESGSFNIGRNINIKEKGKNTETNEPPTPLIPLGSEPTSPKNKQSVIRGQI